MKDLKKQLIRLGNTNPSLRKHIRPILKKAVLNKNPMYEGEWSYPRTNYYYNDKRKGIRSGQVMLVDLPLFTEFKNWDGTTFELLRKNEENGGGLVFVRARDLDTGQIEEFDGEFVVEKSDVIKP